jgi:hypothetical protein
VECAVGFMDSQDAFNKGRTGTGYLSPTDPNYAAWLRGRNELDDQYRQQREPGEPGTVGEYFGALFGAPIGIALIVGVVTLLAGGDYVQWALAAGGATFVVILAFGLIFVAVRLLIVVGPLALLVAVALYLLERIGVGPGLPKF